MKRFDARRTKLYYLSIAARLIRALRRRKVPLIQKPLLAILFLSAFAAFSQELPVTDATPEIKPIEKTYTAKEAKDEVLKAVRAKYISAMDIGAYYDQIDKGKIPEVVKKLNGFKPDENAVLGAANFYPTGKNTAGWRGDGNGRYIAAEPPLNWGRNSKAVLELKGQGGKPKSGDAGTAIPEGVIRDWLVLGPVPAGVLDGKETAWEPSAGDKVDTYVWKPYKADTSWLNFRQIFGTEDPKTASAYACTWIYSSGKPLFLQTMFSGKSKIWLNGKELGSYGENGTRRQLDMQGGWNKLLFKVTPVAKADWSKGVAQWHFNAALFGVISIDSESKNILWTTRMPDNGPGVGSPVVVGDKIFLQAEPDILLCVNKKDGKPLWAAANTLADAATDTERKANSAAFSEADALSAGIKESLQAYISLPDKFSGAKDILGAEAKIAALMQKVDADKYFKQSGSEAGAAAQTPASDGQNVYVIFGSGVVSCFDLEGKRKWTTIIGVRNSEHGYCASPKIIDGKLIVKSSKCLGAAILDCKTGATTATVKAWNKPGLNMYSTALDVSLGNEKLAALSFGVVARARDGKVLAQDFQPPYYNIPDFVSPVTEGRTICSIIIPPWDGNIKFGFQTLPDSASEPLKMKDIKTCTFDIKKFPCWFAYDHCASPLLYQGLTYILSVDGVLTVIDTAKAEVVYQKLLDLSPYMIHNGIVRTGCSGSPTLGGKYIYLFDNQGTCVVIEPGRAFKQVARNRLEQFYYAYGAPSYNENFSSNPVFSGSKMYLRGQVNLYCIGESGKK